jgi:tetratricopeptide (TPR) repeat protein
MNRNRYDENRSSVDDHQLIDPMRQQMPVLLEGTAVVIRNAALERCLDGGASDFPSIAPNAMSFADEDLSQASFMSSRDAELFRDKLLLMGLSGDEDSPDVVLVDAHNQSMTPPCDWLQLMEYKGSLIACLVGNESDVVVAPDSWDPDAGPSLKHMSADEVENRLEFIRRDQRVDVYRDRESGQLLYSARLNDTPEELFNKSADVILNNMRHPGQPPVKESAQSEIREAIGMLQQLANSDQGTWRTWFLLGKAWHAVDRNLRSISSFEKAIELAEQPDSVIYKELAGVLLEDGKTERACQMGEKAVALRPDDVELLGNLAIAYLLDHRVDEAEKALRHALSIDGNDSTNQFIRSKIQAVKDGLIPNPKTLGELEGRLPKQLSERTETAKNSWFTKLMRKMTRRSPG